jgi:hypothetical protein
MLLTGATQNGLAFEVRKGGPARIQKHELFSITPQDRKEFLWTGRGYDEKV